MPADRGKVKGGRALKLEGCCISQWMRAVASPGENTCGAKNSGDDGSGPASSGPGSSSPSSAAHSVRNIDSSQEQGAKRSGVSPDNNNMPRSSGDNKEGNIGHSFSPEDAAGVPKGKKGGKQITR